MHPTARQQRAVFFIPPVYLKFIANYFVLELDNEFLIGYFSGNLYANYFAQHHSD